MAFPVYPFLHMFSQTVQPHTDLRHQIPQIHNFNFYTEIIPKDYQTKLLKFSSNSCRLLASSERQNQKKKKKTG